MIVLSGPGLLTGWRCHCGTYNGAHREYCRHCDRLLVMPDPDKRAMRIVARRELEQFRARQSPFFTPDVAAVVAVLDKQIGTAAG